MKWDGTTPIQHDFTDIEVAIAKRGYDAYHGDGPAKRSWDDLRWSERFRWCFTAYAVKTIPIDHPSRVRTLHRVMLADAHTLWDDLGTGTRLAWARAWRAMEQARDELIPITERPASRASAARTIRVPNLTITTPGLRDRISAARQEARRA